MSCQTSSRRHRRAGGARQRGISLIVAIVFLLLITVLALSGLRGSTTNVQIVGNMQARQETVAAAQAMVERVISDAGFAANPASYSTATRINYDFNGDGVTDSIAQVAQTPACIRARPIPLADLDPALAADIPCFASASAPNPGIIVPTSGPGTSTLCADTEWDLAVRADDAQTGASATVHQGIAMRTSIVAMASACK
jgi:Tfp pilus assembly protein PilV